MFDQQHCYPVLALPGGFQPPDLAWSTRGSAQQGGFQPGVFDPPHELLAANGLAPDPSAADSATLASSIRPPLPPKTGPPSLPTSATGTRKGLPIANPLQLVPSGDPPIADSASGQGQNSDPTDSSDPSIADSSSGQEQNSDPIDPGPSLAGPGSGQEQNSDPTAPSDPSFAVPVLGGQSLSGTVINPSSVVIAGSTIEAGASAVQIQGHQVSIGTAASSIVVDGTSTIPLPADAPVSMNTVAGPTPSPTTTEAPDGVVIADTTLHAGQPAITVSGTPVALESFGLIVGTSTISIQDSSGSALTHGVGGLIYSGINGGIAATSSGGLAGSNQTQISSTGAASGLQVFQGAGSKARTGWSVLVALFIAILLTLLRYISV